MTVGLLFIYNKQESSVECMICIANEDGECRNAGTPVRSLLGEENGEFYLFPSRSRNLLIAYWP